MLKKFWLGLVVIGLVGILTACSNGNDSTLVPATNPTSLASLSGTTPATQPMATTANATNVQLGTDCPKMSAGQPLPAVLPKTFPLPTGTAFTSQETRSDNRLILNGVVPANLADAKAFFEKELVKAGYKVDSADSEAGEAEAEYAGNGIKGRWLIRGNAACPGIITISLLIQPA